VLYGFEGIFTTELHGVNFSCNGSQIPRGELYDPSLATCAIAGSSPGQPSVDGDSYMLSYYGFKYRHVWRNFGIILGMSIAYVVAGLYLMEHIDWSSSSGCNQGLRYIRRRRKNAAHDDLESPQVGASHPATEKAEENSPNTAAIAASQAVFTWTDLRYTIPYAGAERTLLDGVSGFCRPGEMTALVGASGAGKSTCELFQLQHHDLAN
jgi:ATP-binding cassette, subfamily G (WHITE), member 2, SNQ2